MMNFRNLYYAGVKARLGGRMKVEQFSPKKDFLVPAFFAPKEVQKFIEQKKVIYCQYNITIQTNNNTESKTTR